MVDLPIEQGIEILELTAHAVGQAPPVVVALAIGTISQLVLTRVFKAISVVVTTAMRILAWMISLSLALAVLDAYHTSVDLGDRQSVSAWLSRVLNGAF